MKVYFTIEVAIFFILFWLIVSPILLFLPWYQWWNKYDPNRKYNCFHLFLLAYYRSNSLIYNIANTAFSAGNNNMSYKFWPEFLGYIMDGEAIGMVGTPRNPGLCTPKTLCETLVPTDYPPVPFPKIGKRWPQSQAEWRTLLANWAGFSTIPASANAYFSGLSEQTWQNSQGNFLSQWGIPARSPAVGAFITGAYNYKTLTIDQNALAPLLGSNISGSEGVGGGWWGYLHGISSYSTTLNQSLDILWASVDPVIKQKAVKNQGSKCGTAGIAAGAVNFGIMGAAMGAPFVEFGGPIIGAVLGAAIGAFTGALGQPGCIIK